MQDPYLPVKRSLLKTWFYPALALLFGINFYWQLHVYKSQLLPLALETEKITVRGIVASLVEENSELKYKFILKQSVTGRKILLTWDQAAQKPRPGDSWQLQVKLKRPRNYKNPGSFDLENYCLINRIAAKGYVLENAENILLEKAWYRAPISHVRQFLLERFTAKVAAAEFSGIILALVLGSKHLILPQQQEILQNTGVAHLMSISGLHIGLVAGFILLISRSSSLAFCAAASYALISGFAIPCQRALIMLACGLLGRSRRRQIPAWQRFKLALIFVLMCDPLACYATGFWFSFSAVALILYVRPRKVWHLQYLMSLALLPFSLLFFAQVPLISYLSNIIAIPWVSFIVLPLCLGGSTLNLLSSKFGLAALHLANKSLALLWKVLLVSNRAPIYYFPKPLTSIWFYIIPALVAVIWYFTPRGFAGRYWSVLPCIAIFCQPTVNIPYGQAEFALLDVGQGLAMVIRTRQHVLVYDTGPPIQVLVPYLRSVGVKTIDSLIISHPDQDHIGGAEELIRKIPVNQMLISDLDYLASQQRQLCLAGQRWVWDGVQFEILYPFWRQEKNKRNDLSCVLMVQAGRQRLLLTGDIERSAELALVATYGDSLQADTLVVAHHGSKTSSSIEFLEVVKPKVALIPVGYKNQYRHPHPLVLERLQNMMVKVLRTDMQGVIEKNLKS